MGKRPRIFDEYKGTTIYHVWRWDFSVTREFWLATTKTGALHETFTGDSMKERFKAGMRESFDLRALPDAYRQGIDIEIANRLDGRPFAEERRRYWEAMRTIVRRAIDDGFDFSRCCGEGDLYMARHAARRAAAFVTPTRPAIVDDDIPF